MKARIYAFDEVDRPEEVAVALTELRQETVNEVNALREELRGCARNKPMSKKNAKGILRAMVVMILLLAGVSQAQYVQSDISYDIVTNPQQLYQYLRDTIGAVDVFRLMPTSEPTTGLLEGQIYYDTTAGALFVYDSTSDWVELADASGVSLDGAYNAGYAIDVDGTAVTLTVSVGDNNACLIIDQDDTTNDPDALVIDNESDASTSVSIQIDSVAGYDIQGTGDVWKVSYTGVATLIGLVTSTGDVTFTGANYNIIHDASANQLEFQDSAELSFGTDDDISIVYDNTNGDLDITGSGLEVAFGVTDEGMDVVMHGETASTYCLWDESADELLLVLADLKISQGSQIEFIDVSDSATDWTIDNATDETLLIYPTETTDDQSINLGNATNTTDLRIFGATASTVVFDASADEVLFDAYDISLGDGDYLLFGDTLGTGDFSISDQADVLVIDTVVNGTGEIAIGNDANDVPMKWYTDTTGDWVYFNDDEVEFEDCVLIMMDATQLQFGDSADFYIHATNTACTLGTLTTNETSAWNFGANEAGADIKAFGATSGDYLLWDASADYLHMVGDLVLFTLAEAAVNQFKVDATGTGAGDVIVFETTDGGIQLNADGEANGDIEINAGDDMEITTAGALTVATTGATTFSNMATFTVGYQGTVFDAVADDADGAGNSIPAGTSVVNISAVTNSATDWVALPVGVLGEKVTIIATVACELRTLAATDDEINEVDSDGTQEYQLTAGDIVDCICVEAGARWTAVSHTILGAAKTIVPD